VHHKDIARLIHAQMQDHRWEDVSGYEAVVSKGFVELKASAFSAARDDKPLDYRQSPADKSNMARYLFDGFSRCLYPVLKFQSDAERRLAVILDRDALKWFKPAKGQFQIYFMDGADQKEYVPDFVAEDATGIYMLEPKASDEVGDKAVLAKQAAAQRWCAMTSDHAAKYGGKRWRYALIPHNVINDSMSLTWLVEQYAAQ
jgi:type III restriction enzyme